MNFASKRPAEHARLARDGVALQAHVYAPRLLGGARCSRPSSMDTFGVCAE
jgi:hypothetical protein